MEAVTGDAISKACVDFAIRLGAFEENLSGDQAQYTFRVSADVICYVTTADGTVIVDAWNSDGPLYLTPAIASQALGVEVASVSADDRNGSIGDAYDAEGRRVGGVSRLLMQWEAVNEDGILPSEADPSSVPPTPVNPEQSDVYQVNYAPAVDAEKQAQAIAKLVGDYMSGKLKEIGNMNLEQRKAFSVALAEEKTKQRGVSPVIYNGEAYIHPETFDMVSVNDGSSAKEQTILMDYPAVRDNEGYLQIYVNGEWRKINNSKDVKFEISNDPHNPDINQPTTEKLGADQGDFAGLTIPQYVLANTESPAVMMPVIVLNAEDPGEILIRGYGRKQGTLPGLIINTDNEGNPVSARITIISGVGRLFREGDNLNAGGGSGFNEKTALWMELKGNTLDVWRNNWDDA